MVGEDSTVGILRFLFLLTVPDLIQSLRYSVPVAKRFTRTANLPAYIPLPAQKVTTYQAPEYEENYVPVEQDEYNSYFPVYGFYPPAERHDTETYGYVEEEPSGDKILDEERSREPYPYGQETFFEGGSDDAETNAVFPQNLIADQINRAAAGDLPRSKYPTYEEENDRHWSYGIPVTEVDYSEIPDNEDESVKELESLREPALPLKTTNHDVYRSLRMQKKANGNSRKNRVAIDVAKKSRKVDEKGATTSTAAPSAEKSKATQGKSAVHGQKEYVLPRPANPVRRPFERVERASVYNTIKRLLSMEDQARKKVSRIQKRYVLSEEQLTSQLSGLKKMAV